MGCATIWSTIPPTMRTRGGVAAQGAGFHCGDEQFSEQRADLKHAYLARAPPPLVAGPPAFRLRR